MINDCKQCPHHALNGKLCELHSCPLVKRWMPRVIPHGHSKHEMKLFNEFQNRVLQMMFDEVNDNESKRRVQESISSLFLRERALNGDDISLEECYKDSQNLLIQTLATQQQQQQLPNAIPLVVNTAENSCDKPAPVVQTRRHSVARGSSLASLLHNDGQRRRRRRSSSSSSDTGTPPVFNAHQNQAAVDGVGKGNRHQMTISTKRRHSLPASSSSSSHHNGRNPQTHDHHHHHNHSHHSHHLSHHHHNHRKHVHPHHHPEFMHASFSPLHEEDDNDEHMDEANSQSKRDSSPQNNSSSISSSSPHILNITEDMVIPEETTSVVVNPKEKGVLYPLSKFLQYGQPSSIRDFIINSEDDVIMQMDEFLTEHSTNSSKVRDPIGAVMKRCLEMIKWFVMRRATIIPYGMISLFSCEGKTIEGKFIKRFFCEVDQGKELLALKQVNLPLTSNANVDNDIDINDTNGNHSNSNHNNGNSTTLMCQLIREYAGNIQKFKKRKEKERMINHKRSRSHSFSEVMDHHKRSKHNHHHHHSRNHNHHHSSSQAKEPEQKETNHSSDDLLLNSTNSTTDKDISPALDVEISSSIDSSKPIEEDSVTTAVDTIASDNGDICLSTQPVSDLVDKPNTPSLQDEESSSSAIVVSELTTDSTGKASQSQSAPPPAPLPPFNVETGTSSDPKQLTSKDKQYQVVKAGKLINYDTKTGNRLSVRQGHPVWIWDWDQSARIVSGTILDKGNELQAVVSIDHSSWNKDTNREQLISKWKKKINYNTNRSTYRVSFENIQWTEDGGSISDGELDA